MQGDPFNFNKFIRYFFILVTFSFGPLLLCQSTVFADGNNGNNRECAEFKNKGDVKEDDSTGTKIKILPKEKSGNVGNELSSLVQNTPATQDTVTIDNDGSIKIVSKCGNGGEIGNVRFCMVDGSACVVISKRDKESIGKFYNFVDKVGKSSSAISATKKLFIKLKKAQDDGTSVFKLLSNQPKALTGILNSVFDEDGNVDSYKINKIASGMDILDSRLRAIANSDLQHETKIRKSVREIFKFAGDVSKIKQSEIDNIINRVNGIMDVAKDKGEFCAGNFCFKLDKSTFGIDENTSTHTANIDIGRILKMPTNIRYQIPSTFRNVAIVACESILGGCNSDNFAASMMQVCKMETGRCLSGIAPGCTGSHCGYGQLGRNETMLAFQEIQRWAKSGTEENRNYVQELLKRARKIGFNYGALNNDPILGPALLVARHTTLKLEDGGKIVSPVQIIQRIANGNSTVAGRLHMLAQFMPAGFYGGQFTNLNKPLSSAMMRAIGGWQRISGAHTVGQAIAIMGGMRKYTSPERLGLYDYNAFMRALGGNEIKYGNVPTISTFTNNRTVRGISPAQRGFGSPLGFAGAGLQDLFKSMNFGKLFGGILSGDIVPQSVGSSYADTQATYTKQTKTNDKYHSSINYPVILFRASPISVSRGDSSVLIWTATNVQNGNACRLYNENMELLHVSNNGSHTVVIPAVTTATSTIYKLRCTPVDRRVDRSSAEKKVIILIK